MDHRRVWSPELRKHRDTVVGLRSGGVRARRVEWQAAIRDCVSADVVLACDFHDDDVHRLVFQRAVNMLAPSCSGRIGVVIEAVTVTRQTELDAALRSGRRQQLIELLQDQWPFPILAYVDMVLGFHERGWDVIAGQRPCTSPVRMPPRDTPDALRRPVANEAGRGSGAPVKPAPTFPQMNSRLTEFLASWLKKRASIDGDKPILFVLYGAAHQFGRRGVRALLAQRGYRAIVLMPTLNELESAIQETQGPIDWHDWIWLGTDVYRPGLLRYREWVARAIGERRQFDALKRSLPAIVTPANADQVAHTLSELYLTNRARAMPILRTYVQQEALGWQNRSSLSSFLRRWE